MDGLLRLQDKIQQDARQYGGNNPRLPSGERGAGETGEAAGA